MAAQVALATGDAALHVAPAIGGAITRFTWRGHPVLRRTTRDAIAAGDVRACACYPLVPYSNRIRDAQLHFGGHTYALARNFGAHPHAIHGVGWQRAWEVVESTAARVRLALRHDAADDDQRAAWPWAFEATQTLRLDAREDGGCVLHATLCIASRASEPFPFGLGWHPFFPKAVDTTLEFEARALWRNDPTQLPVALEPLDHAYDFSVPRPLHSAALDNVFTGWTGRVSLVQPAAAMRTTLEADRACAWLVVYAPPGRDFVALEPVSHETDAFNRAAAGAKDAGLRVLRPGAAFSCTMRLTVGTSR
jgi:aldose 1-epimerase